MNERRLGAIKARMKDATPGDWSIDLSGEFSVIMDANNFLTLDYGSVIDGIDNANFIANSRQDVSDLLTEVERWKHRFAILEFEVEKIREFYDRIPDDEREVHVVDEILSKLREVKATEIEVNAN